MRFGVLGTGPWAKDVHAAGIAAHPGAELVGVWGRDPAKARGVADAYGARAFAEVDELLDAVDAVAVALPPDVQAELAVRAAAAGRHLLLDKPVALSVEAAEGVAGAVAAAGVRALVFFTARFAAEQAAWLEEVRRRDDWHGVAVTVLKDIYDGGPFGQSSWRRERGALWDMGPHALDLALAVLGPVDRIVAGTGVNDTIHLVAHHAGGASSVITLSEEAPAAAHAESWRVYGPGGSAERPKSALPASDAYRRAVDALLAGGPGKWPGHPADVPHGLEVVRLLAAAEASLAVPLPAAG